MPTCLPTRLRIVVKKYEATWGEDFHVQETRIEDALFFCEEVGYDPDEIQEIHNLEIGETWDSRSYPSHFVKRIQ